MGRDILRGERGHFWHFRRRSNRWNALDAENLRRRASNSFRQNDLRILIAGRADNFYPANIFNPVRRANRKFFPIARDNSFWANGLGGGRNFDGGFDDFGDSQGRTFPDFAFPDNIADFPARNRVDGNIIHGRGVRYEFACRDSGVRFNLDNGVFNPVRLFVRLFDEQNFNLADCRNYRGDYFFSATDKRTGRLGEDNIFPCANGVGISRSIFCERIFCREIFKNV